MKDLSTRIPKQERSIKKRNQIKESGFRLFSEKGYYKTSSNEIAKYADVSIGTFYSYFKNKSDLFAELCFDYYDKVLDLIPEIHIEDSTKIQDTIRLYIQIIFDGHSYMPNFHKEMNVMAMSEERFRQIDEKCNQKMLQKIEQLILKNLEFIRIKNFEVSTFILQKSLEAVAHATKLHPCPYDEKIIIEETTDMICRYVLNESYGNTKI